VVDVVTVCREAVRAGFVAKLVFTPVYNYNVLFHVLRLLFNFLLDYTPGVSICQ
jgi:hypothetical protein